MRWAGDPLTVPSISVNRPRSVVRDREQRLTQMAVDGAHVPPGAVEDICQRAVERGNGFLASS